MHALIGLFMFVPPIGLAAIALIARREEVSGPVAIETDDRIRPRDWRTGH